MNETRISQYQYSMESRFFNQNQTMENRFTPEILILEKLVRLNKNIFLLG